MSWRKTNGIAELELGLLSLVSSSPWWHTRKTAAEGNFSLGCLVVRGEVPPGRWEGSKPFSAQRCFTVTSGPRYNMLLTKCLVRACDTSSCSGLASFLFCPFPERWKGETGSLWCCHVLCLAVKCWVITWWLGLCGEEVAFYNVTSATFTAAHCVISGIPS